MPLDRSDVRGKEGPFRGLTEGLRVKETKMMLPHMAYEARWCEKCHAEMALSNSTWCHACKDDWLKTFQWAKSVTGGDAA